jgi:membrane fusion protein (multidrug efflux system)
MPSNNLPLFFLSSVVVMALTSCGPKPATAPATPPVVLVTEAVQEDVPIFGEAIATLDGSTNTQIRAQVSGYLIKQNYTEGSAVKTGDLLFEIDPKPFQAELDKAQANLESKKAQLLKTKQDMDRYKELVKSGAVSQQEYQNEVQSNQSAQGDVDAAQASVQTAQINLGYTKITAPIDGIVGRALPGLGDLIGPSTQTTTISTVDPIQADFTITEQFYLDHADMIAKMSAIPLADRPANLELLLSDGSAYPKKGRFSYVNRQIQTATGAITAYALFPNPDNVLRPGQYAKVRGVTQRISDAVLVPQRAVNELQGINQVVVVKPDNTVEIRNVTTGNRVGAMWIITAGVKPGERVVVEGIQKCQPGATVTPQPYVAPASDQPTPAPSPATTPAKS